MKGTGTFGNHKQLPRKQCDAASAKQTVALHTYAHQAGVKLWAQVVQAVMARSAMMQGTSRTFGSASGKLYFSEESCSLEDSETSLPSRLSLQAAALAIILGGIQLLNGGMKPVNACTHLHRQPLDASVCGRERVAYLGENIAAGIGH